MKKELPLVCLFFLFLFFGLSLVSYTPLDVSRLSYAFQADPVPNFFGSAGAWASGWLVGTFGLGAFGIPLILLSCLPVYYRGGPKGRLLVIFGGGVVMATACGGFLTLFKEGYILWGSYYTAGGLAGHWLARWLVSCFNLTGAIVVLLFLMVTGGVLSSSLSFSMVGWGIYRASAFVFGQGGRWLWVAGHWLLRLAKQGRQWCHGRLFRKSREKNGFGVLSRWPGRGLGADGVPLTLPALVHSPEKRSRPESSSSESDKADSRNIGKDANVVIVATPLEGDAMKSSPRAAAVRKRRGFELPSLSLLEKKTDQKATVDRRALKEKAGILENKLKDFGISGAVVEILPGPVITTFEYRPAPGVKISKIVNLSDDLALALSALSIRIIAPIPGKDVVGVEIPNTTREVVCIREMLASTAFFESKSRLTLGLGRDILGRPMATPMEAMPHLLIAGATGTGKSVGLNAMIISLLYKATPDEVKFIMVDPKRIELSVYDGIPHLISPVVTDMKKATNALLWAVAEMERRYELLAANGVRNLLQYNRLVEKKGGGGDTLSQGGAPVKGDAGAAVVADENTEPSILEKLPYIVVIVDEFADLMMVASRDVESALIRLAQMARAAGIHLILATQRPSVDVLTGVIKANFPTRISFQVSSRVDSRTILDTNGAETLLGNGDMLFMPPGTSRLTRIQGAYISEEEIARVTTFLKEQQTPDYVEEVTQTADGPAGDSGEPEYDEKYDEAVALVTRTRTASISSVQRHLRIGYNRAARIIETMEKEGIIGPQEGSKPREILVKSLEP